MINLPNAWNRREHVEEQFGRVGLPFELHPAVEAGRLTSEQKALVDRRQRIIHGLRPMNAPALACLMSHMAVFRALVDRGEDMCAVFEDDAVLHPDLPEVLDALEGNAQRFDILMLNRRRRSIPYVPLLEIAPGRTVGRLRYS